MGQKLRCPGQSERAEIRKLHSGGAPAAVAAEKAGCHTAAIYRELPNGYTGAGDEALYCEVTSPPAGRGTPC